MLKWLYFDISTIRKVFFPKPDIKTFLSCFFLFEVNIKFLLLGPAFNNHATKPLN